MCDGKPVGSGMVREKSWRSACAAAYQKRGKAHSPTFDLPALYWVKSQVVMRSWQPPDEAQSRMPTRTALECTAVRTVHDPDLGRGATDGRDMCTLSPATSHTD